MAQKPRPVSDNVYPLFGEDEDVSDEIQVGYQLTRSAPVTTSPTLIDLTGKPKLVVAIGSGGCGKTTFMRWVSERALAGGSTTKIAAIDPTNRDLLGFFARGGAYEPPSRDTHQVAGWLKAFIDALISEQVSGLVDTGGGDQAFGKLIADMPGLVDGLSAEGIEVVAVYMFGTRIADIGPMATLTDAGFTPAATALVLNDGLPPLPGETTEQAQAPIRRHSVYRAALERGAVELHMPLLPVAKKLEARRLQYRHAAENIMPTDRKVTPLGWSDRQTLKSWLRRMDAAMAPISTWLP